MSSGHAASFFLGRLLRAHGLRGDLVLQLYRARRVPPGGMVRHAGESVRAVFEDRPPQDLKLIGVRPVDGMRRVVHFLGVDGRDQAEALLGADLEVEVGALPSLLVDDADQLIGAMAYLVDSSQELGPIQEIRDNGAQPILVIGDEEILIPFVPAFVGALEDGPNGRRVSVTPIPGLLEVNRP